MVNNYGIYKLTLRAPDGRERRELAWLPNEMVEQDLIAKYHKRGVSVTLTPIEN